MPLYRVKQAGYYIGKYYNEGEKLSLHEKQAKYGLMTGQIEKMPAAVEPKSVPLKAAAVGEEAPRKSKVKTRGERSTGRSVGGSFGGSFGQ